MSILKIRWNQNFGVSLQNSDAILRLPPRNTKSQSKPLHKKNNARVLYGIFARGKSAAARAKKSLTRPCLSGHGLTLGCGRMRNNYCRRAFCSPRVCVCACVCPLSLLPQWADEQVGGGGGISRSVNERMGDNTQNFGFLQHF